MKHHHNNSGMTANETGDDESRIVDHLCNPELQRNRLFPKRNGHAYF